MIISALGTEERGVLKPAVRDKGIQMALTLRPGRGHIHPYPLPL